jgi:hypothetical protein
VRHTKRTPAVRAGPTSWRNKAVPTVSESVMSFRNVFIAITIAAALIVAAFLINARRPATEVDQPSAEFVRATGKCAECHANLQYAVVHEFEMSAHAARGINCLDCHQTGEGQSSRNHHGFVINTGVSRPTWPRRWHASSA